MNTFSDRIDRLIQDRTGGNKSKFARQLNVTPAYISKLCKDKENIPSDRTIADICREFNVNEDWLRTGRGDPYIQLSRDEELAQFFGEVMKGEDPDFRRRLLSVMSRLTTDEWALLEQMAWKLVDELRQDSGQEASSEEGKKNPGPP